MALKRAAIALVTLILVSPINPATAQTGSWTLVGWNNLGMHCMDADYSVFSLLPPYNTIHAQLIDPQGKFVTNPNGMRVTYEAIADPTGSVNTTSMAKTTFWDHLLALFGVSLPVDTGLAGKAMPGTMNTPQSMSFDATNAWFIAEGIPLTPYDDAQLKNPYPLMHLVARDQSGTVLATLDIVLPVSDEMSCLTCHTSGSDPAAQPAAGWVNDSDPQRDMRLNILRLHDDRQATDSTFKAALSAGGYNAAGLFATAVTDGQSILCANCHASAALSTNGLAGTKPLTQAMHGHHATVLDPTTGLTLDASNNRSACYRCHPGSLTRCLRGAMGSAVAPDGTLAMQCQSCHGTMSVVAAATRSGWLNEPMCQDCHTGTAVSNNGQIRYTSVFDSPGHVRQAVDRTFATTLNVPPGFSLYRFSIGHGGVKCEGCHGSTHAEFPSSHTNDNIQSVQHQGHVGMFVECVNCHATQPVTVTGGPHGMHPVGQAWVNSHAGDIGEGGGGNLSHGDGSGRASGSAQCQVCHGTDYRGTVLSRAQADRVLNAGQFGTKQLWRGFQVGCYTCHLGPGGGDQNPNRAPVVQNAKASTTAGTPIGVTLSARDPNHDPLTLRIVTQPANGTAAMSGTTATYSPGAGFAGSDSFTFAASDGSTDSNLGTVSVSVGGGSACPASKCGHTVADALTALISAVTTCQVRQADLAFKGKSFAEETCEQSAQAKFDKAIARVAASCPAQVTTNANAARDALLSGAQSLDTQNGTIYCDAASGRPLDPGGDDLGFVPASKANLTCADGVAKYLNKLASSVLSCQRRWADTRLKGKTFDLTACQNAAVAKATTARDQVLKGGGCADCLGQPGQDALRNGVASHLATMRPLIFLCPVTTAATTPP